MFVEEFEKPKFESSRGRDEFIELVLNSLDPVITEFELNEIPELINK